MQMNETFNEQLRAAVQIDEIEEFEDNANHNHKEDDDDDEDIDIVIDRAANVNIGSIKCPLTQRVFVEPVKSRECGHTFEREAVENYIESQEQRQEMSDCPLPGCNNILTKDQLIRDVMMEKKIKAQSKQDNDKDSDDEVLMDLTVPFDL